MKQKLIELLKHKSVTGDGRTGTTVATLRYTLGCTSGEISKMLNELYKEGLVEVHDNHLGVLVVWKIKNK